MSLCLSSDPDCSVASPCETCRDGLGSFVLRRAGVAAFGLAGDMLGALYEELGARLTRGEKVEGVLDFAMSELLYVAAALPKAQADAFTAEWNAGREDLLARAQRAQDRLRGEGDMSVEATDKGKDSGSLGEVKPRALGEAEPGDAGGPPVDAPVIPSPSPAASPSGAAVPAEVPESGSTFAGASPLAPASFTVRVTGAPAKGNGKRIQAGEIPVIQEAGQAPVSEVNHGK